MAKKEEKLFSADVTMKDSDYEEIFRIYMETEHGKDRKIAIIACGIIAAILVVLRFVFGNNIFLVYGVACILVGAAYLFVPVNKKFLAQNKLQFGDRREIGFYQHRVTTIEILEDEEPMNEEEIEAATTEISTYGMNAYESEKGILFADGKISNQFLYLPKRCLSEEEIEAASEFAKNCCSGGYRSLVLGSMLAEEEQPQEKEDGGFSLVDAVCDQYYGGKRLHCCEEECEESLNDDEWTEDAEEENPHIAYMDDPEDTE